MDTVDTRSASVPEDGEKIIEIQLERLRTFKNHPFKIRMDQEIMVLPFLHLLAIQHPVTGSEAPAYLPTAVPLLFPDIFPPFLICNRKSLSR